LGSGYVSIDFMELPREAYEELVPVPRAALEIPVVLPPPAGFDPERLETWPRVEGRASTTRRHISARRRRGTSDTGSLSCGCCFRLSNEFSCSCRTVRYPFRPVSGCLLTMPFRG
jgi:hypothetical protein